MTLDEAINHVREVAERIQKDANKQKGLNHGYYVWQSVNADKYRQIAQWLQELKEYRDLEEQGLLLKLPCKVGDTLYFVSRNKIIEELIVLKITYQDKFIITFRDESNDIGNVSEKYIGKTVFLTKEEAEKALERLECAE